MLILISIASYLGYFLLNTYIIIRGWQALERFPKLRYPVAAAITWLSLSFASGRILQKYFPEFGYKTFLFSGWYGYYNAFWFAAMLYILMLLIPIDILRIINRFFKFFPASITNNYKKVKAGLFFSITITAGIIVLIGYLNSRSFEVNELNIDLPKKHSSLDKLKIVLLSDIHLCVRNDDTFLQKIVDKVNTLNPDLVVLAGDIVDAGAEHLKMHGIGESFRNLKSKYGVYACTGNHEYLNNGEEVIEYISQFGVNWLRDTSVVIAGSVNLIGREDLIVRTELIKKRKDVKELVNEADSNFCTILLDHTPVKLGKSVEAGIDLQLSGHTHGGQVFPFTIINNFLFELPYGYMKKGNTQFYVSSGAGTWGPQVKLGTDAEIVLLNIQFK